VQNKINTILNDLNKKKNNNNKILIKIKKIIFEIQSIIGVNKDDNTIKIISNNQKKIFKLLSKVENEFKKLKK